MTEQEYSTIQNDLTALISGSKKQDKDFNSKEWEIYKIAIAASKSVLSNFNPSKNRKERIP